MKLFPDDVTWLGLLLDVGSILISGASAVFAYRAWRAAKVTAVTNMRKLEEYWIEKVKAEVKRHLPAGDINHKVGLSVASLLDSLPAELVTKRKFIVKSGFQQVIPVEGKFRSFWHHLCAIQSWPEE